MKIIINSNNKEKNLDEFIDFLLKLKTKNEMGLFLKGILTPKELIELPNRLLIVKLIKKGIPQQEIAQRIQVGVATITRGAREIQRGRFNNV
jgi:TrpR family transcriptional regulator, trp operon repressor